MKPKLPSAAAAIAGVPTGVQSHGMWAGRRQLFVRFAHEAETATMFTAQALASELKRLTERSRVHSISLAGRDALGNLDFIAEALHVWTPTVPVMIDSDGQRPEAIPTLKPYAGLIQVTLDPSLPDAFLDRTLETLEAAASSSCDHALAIAPRPDTSDSQILRIMERVHTASAKTSVVLHPATITGSADSPQLDRRWAALVDHASNIHGDVRVIIPIPPPTGMR